MLNKIDNNLLGKIKILSLKDEVVEIIVRAYNYSEVKKEIVGFACDSEVIELPLISSIALSVRLKDISKIASNNNIKYVSSNSKVCGLIFDSKRIIGLESLTSKIKSVGTHCCVVIDTGIYPHIDFCLGKNRIIKFVDLINGRNAPYDDNGHGTFVSGVFCGNSITNKFGGIDNNCRLIVIKALDGDGETSTIKILQAMQWIIDNREKYNIKVVCMSFGSELGSGQDPLIFGAEALWKSGVVVVSAGGNSGPEESTIMSPGASRRIITVGSLDNSRELPIVADFSSRGPANGYFKPDMLVPGVNIISTNVFDENRQLYTKMSGTSVSTPMVAGVCSLLLCINPNYTPDEIKYMLIKSCIRISFDRNAEGYGVLDLNRLRLI